MTSLHSLLENMASAGNLYGWRLDAILIGGLFWGADCRALAGSVNRLSGTPL